MPMQLTVDSAAGVARTIVSGPFTADDLHDHLRKVLERKAYRYPSLVDVREAEPATLRPRDLLQMAHLIRDGLSRRPMAPCA